MSSVQNTLASPSTGDARNASIPNIADEHDQINRCSAKQTVSATEADIDALFKAVATGRVFVEDQIALERSGQASGYKAGALRRLLSESDAALKILKKLEAS